MEYGYDYVRGVSMDIRHKRYSARLFSSIRKRRLAQFAPFLVVQQEILISITILISAFLFYYILDSLTLLSFVSPMREANTLFVSLKTFLYIRPLLIRNIFKKHCLGLSPIRKQALIYSDTTFYIGF